MKITGGTFFLNPLSLDYPIIEWTEAALRFCDEIILIDMGSKDGTRRALRNRFGNKIRIINEPWQFTKDYHEGIPRNVILREASNPWIYLTDSDEFLHENDIEKVVAFTEQESVDIVKLPIRTFYGSCYLVYSGERRSRLALIRKDKGFYFGPLKNKGTSAADTLKWGNRPARRCGKLKDVPIPLYDYGRCRPPSARLGSVDFFIKQHQARTGQIPVGIKTSIQDYFLPYPDLKDKHFTIFSGTHPQIMGRWIKKHWKSHGWEI